jgi:ParB/RepB/Spo0J family partition protein
MTTITDTTNDLTSDPNVTDPAYIEAGDVKAVEPVPDTTTPTGELVQFPVDVLAPHPDNPRTSLGDLDELARSIKAQGVLQPVVVLPVGEDGRHLLVTGHRRHAAAIKANVGHVPGVVRDLTPAEVIEAMLVENVNRSDLSTSEEVRAIERLMDLSAGKLTPAKLCKRIGRSQGWVRTRMAICALPPQRREAIDRGELSLAAGEAAASVADLGPEHVEELCSQFTRHTWGDHARLAEAYRQRIEREAAYEAAVAKARRRKGAVVFTSDDDIYGAMALSDFLDADDVKAHRREPCHAVLIERTTYGQGYERTDICTDPERHAPDPADAEEDDDVTDPSGPAGNGDEPGDGRPWPHRPAEPGAPSGPDLTSSHLKRKGRVARTAFTKEVFARPRGGISQAQATRMALRALIYEAGMEALSFAADVLGVEDHSYGLTDRLLTMADTPAALTRVAGAVAMGIAESRMYHGHHSTPCRDYLAALTGAGWDPDTWTAAIIDQQTRRDQAEAEQAEPTDTDTAEQPGEDDAKAAEPTDDEPAPTGPTDDDAQPTDIDSSEPAHTEPAHNEEADVDPAEPSDDAKPAANDARPTDIDPAEPSDGSMPAEPTEDGESGEHPSEADTE